MIVLALETSCDDTCAAVTDDARILSNVISSQAAAHARPHTRRGGSAQTPTTQTHSTVQPSQTLAGHAAHSGTKAGAGVVATRSADGAAVGVAAEAPDPEEAKSFPLPASTQHRSASTPSVAGEAAVAPGAPSDAEVKRELLAAGARPRRAALTGPDALTAGERRVAALAADGASNRQIAEHLFVTQATVETHLRHAFRKLNITSRADLPATLA